MDKYVDALRLAVRQPVLSREVGEVDIDQAKVFFLLLPLLNGEKWTASIDAAAVAVGAVHIAFDAHDVIHHDDATTTLQQLTVLAGDYYSGVHYKILAALPDIHFIRTLSTSIGRINEIKTNLYNDLPKDVNELLDIVATIEARCIEDFLHTYGFSKYCPLVKTTLSMIALSSVSGGQAQANNVQETLNWKLNQQDLEQAQNSLTIQLELHLDEADFITPFLKEEIISMTTAVIGN